MTNEKSPVIKLPNNPELVSKLERKLVEYRERLEKREANIRAEYPYSHPEQIEVATRHLAYKIAVLSTLLRDKEVKTYDLSLDLVRKTRVFSSEDYNDACGVIEDYCTTGGQRARGGTGLK